MNNLPKKMNPATQNMNPHQISYRIRKNVVFIRFSKQNPPPPSSEYPSFLAESGTFIMNPQLFPKKRVGYPF
jgi:hypothetical protein